MQPAGQAWRALHARRTLACPAPRSPRPPRIAQVGQWLRSFDGLDLRRFRPVSYGEIMGGWGLPLLFVGLGFPAIVAAGGWSGAVMAQHARQRPGLPACGGPPCPVVTSDFGKRATKWHARPAEVVGQAAPLPCGLDVQGRL